MKGIKTCSVVGCDKSVVAAVETPAGVYRVCIQHMREANEGRLLTIDTENSALAPFYAGTERPPVVIPRLLPVDGGIRCIQPHNTMTFTTEELQNHVGGYFEILHIDASNVMVIDEDAMLKQSSPNSVASLLAGQTIYGDALVCASDMVP